MDLPLAAAPSPESAAAGEIADTEAATGETPDTTEASGEDDGRARRRGRRGGRRRRKEPTEGEAPAVEAQADEPASFDQAPVYNGPTPADPFGLVYDIFDIMDEPEPQTTPAVAAPGPEPVAEIHHTIEPEAAPADAVVEAMPLPEPQPAEAAVLVAPVAEASAAPEPVVETTLAVVEEEPPLMNGHDDSEPAAVASAEPVSTPAPPPVLVGEAPVADKKRGWWRR